MLEALLQHEDGFEHISSIIYTRVWTKRSQNNTFKMKIQLRIEGPAYEIRHFDPTFAGIGDDEDAFVVLNERWELLSLAKRRARDMYEMMEYFLDRELTEDLEEWDRPF